MCSHSVLRSILYGVTALLFATIAIIMVGITVNSNLITSWYTPLALGIAIGSMAGIIAFLAKFLNDLRNFDLCVNQGVFNFCKGKFNTLAFMISSLIGLLTAQIGAMAAILWIAWAPGTAIPILGKTAYALITIQSLTMVAIWAMYGSLISCLRASPVGNRVAPMFGERSTPPPPQKKPIGRIAVATCTLNKATCADNQMVQAGESNGLFSTAKTFALLFKPVNNLDVQSINAVLTDSYKNSTQLDMATDYFKPSHHQILDPSYHAIRVRWDYVSRKGILADISITGRKWTLEVNMTLSDGSKDRVTLRVLVSN